MPRAAGFTYIALLIGVAIIGVGLAATGVHWATAQKREKERQLLFIGGEFRRAIAQYAEKSTNQVTRYPMSLDDLLKDTRYPITQRYLRQIYVDPMTGSRDWGLLKGPAGEIYGVFSQSEEAPLKVAGFDPADAQFEGRGKYSEWIFMSLRATAQNPTAIKTTKN
jgi:type II secretory pathway pseudopilin PulG